MAAPDTIFIVPYRDRDRHRTFFRKHMQIILEDSDVGSYRIYFVHQRDTKPFNRGAMKNIGFLAMKKEYPDGYKKISFVFNDIDVMPFDKTTIPTYKTTEGLIKHFYGFDFALGGIVSITGGDFEKLDGFPNFWAWGWEDNELHRRVLKMNDIVIDRTTFYPILSQEMIHLHHGLFRDVNPIEKRRYELTTSEGIKDVVLDSFMVVEDMVEVFNFTTATLPSPERTESVPFGGSFSFKKSAARGMQMIMTRR